MLLLKDQVPAQLFLELVAKLEARALDPEEEASQPEEEASQPEEEASQPEEEASQPEEEAPEPEEGGWIQVEDSVREGKSPAREE